MGKVKPRVTLYEKQLRVCWSWGKRELRICFNPRYAYWSDGVKSGIWPVRKKWAR